MRTIRLTGALGRKFGRIHRLAVDTPAEAIRALCVLLQGFRAELETPGNHYRILIGKEPALDPERECQMRFGPERSFTFAPVIAGSKSALGGILAGIALIGLSFVPGLNVAIWASASSLTWAGLAFNIGVALVLGGVSQMLTPMPKTGEPKERPENTPNTQFSGPVNTQAQGQPVPIVYGELVCGSAVISAGLSNGFTVSNTATSTPTSGSGTGTYGGPSFSKGGGTGYETVSEFAA